MSHLQEMRNLYAYQEAEQARIFSDFRATYGLDPECHVTYNIIADFGRLIEQIVDVDTFLKNIGTVARASYAARQALQQP